MKHIGIDPGASGAICILEKLATGGYAIQLFDTPTIKVKVGKTMRSRPNLAALYALMMDNLGRSVESFAMLEAVQPQPTFGGSTNFWLGHSLGSWESMLSSMQIPYRTIRAQEWKKQYSIVKDDKAKSTARALAIKMFPQCAPDLARVKDDGRAEALLIAAYSLATYWDKEDAVTPNATGQRELCLQE